MSVGARPAAPTTSGAVRMVTPTAATASVSTATIVQRPVTSNAATATAVAATATPSRVVTVCIRVAVLAGFCWVFGVEYEYDSA